MSAVVSTCNSHSILRGSGRPVGGLVDRELTAGSREEGGRVGFMFVFAR